MQMTLAPIVPPASPARNQPNLINWRTGKPVDSITPTKTPKTGLGDAIASVATPIARILGLPCVDPITKQLKPDSLCAKRKAALNRAIPSIGL